MNCLAKMMQINDSNLTCMYGITCMPKGPPTLGWKKKTRRRCPSLSNFKRRCSGESQQKPKGQKFPWKLNEDFFWTCFFPTSFALYFQVVVDLEVLGKQTRSISGWLLRQVLGAGKKNTSPLELPQMDQMVICHIGPSNPSRRIRIRVNHHDQNILTNYYHFLKRSWGPPVNLISKTGSFLYKRRFGAKCTKTCGDHMMDKRTIKPDFYSCRSFLLLNPLR